MLRYKYTQNSTDLDLPFHIHGIMSDSNSLAISINGNKLGDFKPNMFDKPSEHNFTKHFVSQDVLLQLLIVGSRQEYDDKESNSFFNSQSITYITSDDGRQLYRDPDTGLYRWDLKLRSRFYFNPHYFDSAYLWQLRLGYVPTNTSLTYQWPEDFERRLFLPPIFVVGADFTWSGSKEIEDIAPLVNDYFSTNLVGEDVYMYLNDIIDLKTLKSGDLLELTNGREILSIDVKLNEETLFIYDDLVETTRPILHADILTINPNGSVHYAKGFERYTQELITVTLYGKQIQFTGRRL